ncbi:hypothetical protein TTHERM_00391470 (macronuclear) [Tetrahymena thermophila SB210]|uniref:PI-PLC Y-box domain-containing protein n=1 Tax=Tetrahymena thermophila (strain SB210) TaxID=312017 RepID=Q233K3_TETTS|nr:hypothetical protein TTHERM_00391470 [Tetrahymena thermophila SB210]EAR91577.2 hypothetical protein TTHERM_00391470 [Tetrahymena thermophila SB210]|eukprot:XP_001011822.2 hypothetical protein TTHERM_00391470 [Tetrahymena thermophila SB210]
MQTLRTKQIKNQGNWNNFFPSVNNEQFESNQCNERLNNVSYKTQNQIQNDQKKEDWNGEYFYVEINQISIPIPTFVNLATKNKLIQTIQEVQQQVDNHLNIPSLKQQILDKMYKDFVNKNCELLKEINNTPLNNKTPGSKKQKKNIKNQVVDSNPSLTIHIENQKKLFQQNPHPNTQNDDVKSDITARESFTQRYEVINKNFSANQADEFRQFVNNVFITNIKQSNQLQNYIQQYLKNKETKNKTNNNKYLYLFCKEDYIYDAKFIEETLNSIYRFGVDRCKIQKNQNQIIMSETIRINFQERKTLKTIIYSILHHNLCKQDQKSAKQYIYKTLAHINPKIKGFEQENYILRQIFLLFLQIIIINSDHSNQTTEFLDNIFQFEFLSSLLCDYLLFSAKKILKIKNHTNQNHDLNTLIDQLSKANDFNLYLFSLKQADCKKYSYANHKSREIFIYFEQSLQQNDNQSVYYVINPNDQLVCFANSAF